MQFDRQCIVETAPIAGGIGRRFEGLRVKFNIEKDLLLTSNKSKVDIYNLSQGSRETIKEHLTHIKLFAGYVDAGGAALVFEGDLDYVSHVTQPPDIVSACQVGDGRKQLRESVLSLSLPPGTNASEACRTICQRVGLSVGELPPTAPALANGFSFMGSGAEALRRMTSAASLTVSVQDNKAQFVKQGGARAVSVIVVSPSTGLIASPARVTRANTTGQLQGIAGEDASFEDGADLSALEGPQVPQWSFKMLLNPSLVPGGLIELDTRAVQGRFKLTTVKHSGDTRGPEWHSECEVQKE